jgi:hypothetical protein
MFKKSQRIYHIQFENISAMKKYRSEPTVRQQLGITQEEYAVFLQTRVVQLAMYEIDQRQLSGKALLKNGLVAICLEKKESSERNATALAVQQQQAVAQLQKRIKKCNWLITRQEHKLAKLEVAAATCYNVMQVVGFMQETEAAVLPNANTLSSGDYEWLDLFGHIAMTKLETCGLAAQQTVRLKINALKYEIEQAQQIIDEMMIAG